MKKGDLKSKKKLILDSPGTGESSKAKGTKRQQKIKSEKCGLSRPAAITAMQRILNSSDHCAVCGKWDAPDSDSENECEDEEVEDKWLGCERCDRWYHIQCIDDTENFCDYCN